MKKTAAVLLVVAVAMTAGGCVMQSTHDKVVAQLGTTEGLLAVTKADLSTATETLAARDKELAATQTELTSAKSTLATVGATLKTTQEDLKTTREVLVTTQRAQAAAESDNKRLKAGLAALAMQCRAAGERLKGAEVTLAELQAGGERMAAAMAELKKRISLQSTSVGALGASIRPLSAEIAELVRRAAALAGEKAPATPPVKVPPVKTPPAKAPPVKARPPATSGGGTDKPKTP